jgi:quercetin dioxygenase-like cupin family protein
MPIILNPEQMEVTHTDDGWTETTLADARSTGTAAMVARRWVLQPGIEGPERVHGDVDQLLYVMRGSGTVIVNGAEFPLGHESILWLEPGERYRFVAGPGGLEILQGYAPGE